VRAEGMRLASAFSISIRNVAAAGMFALYSPNQAAAGKYDMHYK
jgi:hypothetical protein